ncbi:MAG: hypothetical protein ABEJ99_04440 [Candidatus Nanohaloarchaea archaeon]
MADNELNLDPADLQKTSKPLFYGFTFLSGVTMIVSPKISGVLLGVATMAAIAFVSGGLSDVLDEDWKKFMHIVGLVTLLGAVLAGSWIAAALSLL